MSSLQAAGRRVAYHTFAHVLGLDITFHLERRTGVLSRILERGVCSGGLYLRIYTTVSVVSSKLSCPLALVCDLHAVGVSMH